MVNSNSKLPMFGKLAPLETFDPNALLSNDKEEQKVCNFVLALALIYNDFKNVGLTLDYLLENKPRDRVISGYNGQYFGFMLHLDRLRYSILKELFKLIEDNLEILKHPLFVRIGNSLSKDTKKCWQSIIDFSTRKNIDDKNLMELFERIRNKVAFHADPKEIMSGYRSFFFGKNKEIKMQAYVSRGRNLQETRFYFADAAAEKYLDERIEAVKTVFANRMRKCFDDVSRSLYEIVCKFVNVIRGYAWREHRNASATK